MEFLGLKQSGITVGSLPPEDIPTVSMDIEMGDSYRLVDFDYGEFKEQASRINLSSESTAELSISIAPKSSSRIKGRYLPRNVELPTKQGPHIDVKMHSSEKKMNKAFAHELQHFADDEQGLMKKNDSRYEIGKIAGILAPPASYGYLGGQLSQTMDKDLPIVDSTLYAGAFVALSAAAVWGYLLHPTERRARKAAKENTSKVISFYYPLSW